MWQLEVELSEGVVHQYRYCVVLQLPDQTTIVRRWETHLLPRQVLGGGGGGGGAGLVTLLATQVLQSGIPSN